MRLLISICILCIIRQSSSDIIIFKNNSNHTEHVMADLEAIFGPSLPYGGLTGLVVYATPSDGCSLISPPPKVHEYAGFFIALIRRYNCSFVDKVLNAQLSGYHAAIVRNVGSDAIEVMSGDHNTDLVLIPSVFISESDGLKLESNYQYDSGYCVKITDEFPIRIQDYLIPFVITVGICLILMFIFMVVKWIRDYKQSRRHRLSSSALKKIPTIKFKKGDPYDCCAICLEDYKDDDKLRVLPCSHAYHTRCIDPWLTKNRRVCPVCKRKVIIGNENPSDFDTETDDENAPLVDSGNNTQGGTFNEQRENPFQWAERQRERRQLREQRNRVRRNAQYQSLSDESSAEETDCSSDEIDHHQQRRLQAEAPCVVDLVATVEDNISDVIPTVHVAVKNEDSNLQTPPYNNSNDSKFNGSDFKV